MSQAASQLLFSEVIQNGEFLLKEGGARKLWAHEKKELFQARSPSLRGKARVCYSDSLSSFEGWKGSLWQITGADQKIPGWPIKVISLYIDCAPETNILDQLYFRRKKERGRERDGRRERGREEERKEGMKKKEERKDYMPGEGQNLSQVKY